ncbi:MAG: DUF501 domain-containing protein [Synergistetes bacterium]|nr:DUF501 domain-containing protein [Synergistota bacterium]MCX8128445.1 DUF501 domain-containing protein [Synergistota bacterium]MDW8193134.1 DUF501 domain-containing protein [Synergistota bacterium]
MYHGGSEYLKDLKIVRWQISKKISGFLNVAKRCSWGYPQVILCYPLKKGKPFPTLYWLTCPYLNKRVGDLESKGMISDLLNKIETNADLRKKLKEANKAYAEKRAALLSEKIRNFLKLKFHSYLEVIEERGIGGVTEPEGVKCLHAHLAYYLADGKTPIGEEVLKILSSSECLDKPKCAMIESCKQFRYCKKGVRL